MATQNIMDGCLLLPLIDEFERAGIARAVDVLCVQENVLTPEPSRGAALPAASHHAARIADAMRRQAARDRRGQPQQQQLPQRRFVCHRCEDAPRLCTIYDAGRLRLESSCLIPLPLLDPVPWYSRLVFKSVAERKHALVTVFSLCERSTDETRRLRATADIDALEASTSIGPLRAPTLARSRHSGQEQVVVVNLHLDAMGDNAHRIKQLQELATQLLRQLPQLGLPRGAPPGQQQNRESTRGGETVGFVACGDTNIFAVSRTAQRQALARAFAPLTALGARLCEHADTGASGGTDSARRLDCLACLQQMSDTHFFARANEPKFPQQVAVAAGRLGVEIPGLFDVVATDLPVLDRHHWQIMSSDHDCVGATVRVAQAARRLTDNKEQ